MVEKIVITNGKAVFISFAYRAQSRLDTFAEQILMGNSLTGTRSDERII